MGDLSQSETSTYDELGLTEPEHPCSMCRGEGAIGTGYSASFVDPSDAMPCPRCEGSGEEPDA